MLAMRSQATPTPAEEAHAAAAPTLSPEQIAALAPERVAALVVPDLGPRPHSLLEPRMAPPSQDSGPTADWRPSGEGTFAVDEPGFTAEIARDGRVTIADKPSFQFAPRIVGVQEAARIPGEDSEGGGGPMLITAQVAIFDLTDFVMRRAGMDPYSSAKARLLDESREHRAEMRVRANAEDTRNALALLTGHLDEIWRDGARTPEERRRAMFDLWDECAEDGADAVVEASHLVRVSIESYIRRTLPAGSAHAYSPDELRTLNAQRRSRARFAPYDDK